MDPIREPRNLPPPAPVTRVGSGRSGDAGGQERAGANGERGATGGGDPAAVPHRRGTLPPRAGNVWPTSDAVRRIRALAG